MPTAKNILSTYYMITNRDPKGQRLDTRKPQVLEARLVSGICITILFIMLTLPEREVHAFLEGGPWHVSSGHLI